MTEFGREYGEGLYALCAEEHIERDALQEVQVLKESFRENGDFIRLLGNLTLPKEQRVAIVDDTLKGSVHEYVLNFIKILVEREINQKDYDGFVDDFIQNVGEKQ